MTKLLAPDDAGLDEAATLLRQGELVAFPTETVYGLGADATNGRAVAAVYAAKGRPQFNPLIVHVADLDAARAIADFSEDALRLAQAFWPGPLSLVLPVRPDAGLSDLVTAGLSTVAVRVPQHPLAHALLEKAGIPVAAPSANPSGRISPTRAEHVLDGLNGRIAAVLDGGSCPVGLESTIVSAGPPPVLLRHGGIPVEALEACLGQSFETADPAKEGVSAPGQLLSHYAPVVPVRLGATEAREGEALLGFGPIQGHLTLSANGDLTEAAANLFSHLRRLDEGGYKAIAVAPIPYHGLGRAINDRLLRAAAPRDADGLA